MRWPLIWVLLLWLGFNPQAMATQPGEPAPALVLPLLGNDKEIRLSDFEGKIVYVDFWASWCGPCRQSLPLYEELYSRLPKDRFQILAVNLDEKLKDADSFLKRHPVSYPVLLDPSGNSARAWSVLAMPSSYLVDPDGKLIRIYVGFEASHIGNIEHDIKTLLDSMPGARVDGSDGLR
jgi:cytochrome c biogenesis protein CcmG/thiol:disulfide interchange protein DsbE